MIEFSSFKFKRGRSLTNKFLYLIIIQQHVVERAEFSMRQLQAGVRKMASSHQKPGRGKEGFSPSGFMGTKASPGIWTSAPQISGKMNSSYFEPPYLWCLIIQQVTIEDGK